MAEKKKHPGGRPTLYNAEMLRKAKDYLNNYKEFGGQVIPSVAGLAIALGVSKQVMYDWCEIHPEFLDTLTAVKETQEALLLNKGLSGEYQPTITKLLLSNHGHHERQEVQHDGIDKISVIIQPVDNADKDKAD